jgi:hypothetical protein
VLAQRGVSPHGSRSEHSSDAGAVEQALDETPAGERDTGSGSALASGHTSRCGRPCSDASFYGLSLPTARNDGAGVAIIPTRVESGTGGCYAGRHRGG